MLSKGFIFALFLAVAGTVFAVEVPIGDVRLPDGTVLSSAVAIGNNPTGINVRHAAGVTFVYYRHLPPSMRGRLGYDTRKEQAYYARLKRYNQYVAAKKRQQEANERRAEGIKKREKEIEAFQRRLNQLMEISAGGGTGFLITPEGHIVTNEHVIRKAARTKRSKIIVVWLDRLMEAKILAHDREKDLAVLKLEIPSEQEYEKRKREILRKNKDAVIKPRVTEFPCLPLSRENVTSMGSNVFTIGFPQPILHGWTPKLAEGTVSSVRGMHGKKDEYQLMMPTHGGNSGGAVVDVKTGCVMGVLTAGFKEDVAFGFANESAATISYAQKINLLGDLLKKVDKFPYKKLRPAPVDAAKVEREALIDYTRRSTVALQVVLPVRRGGAPFDD